MKGNVTNFHTPSRMFFEYSSPYSETEDKGKRKRKPFPRREFILNLYFFKIIADT